MENREFLERARTEAAKPEEKKVVTPSHNSTPDKYAVNSRGEVLTKEEAQENKHKMEEGQDAWREQK